MILLIDISEGFPEPKVPGMLLSYGKQACKKQTHIFHCCFPTKEDQNLCANLKMNYNVAEGLIAK